MLRDTEGMKGGELCGAVRPQQAGQELLRLRLCPDVHAVRGLVTGCYEPSVCCRLRAGLRRLRRRRLALLLLLLQMLVRQLRTSLLAERDTIALQDGMCRVVRGYCHVEQMVSLLSSVFTSCGACGSIPASSTVAQGHTLGILAALGLQGLRRCVGGSM